ncbi:MAG: hypothetical protein R3E82_22840 [Pseudomonadales bacterium]
MHAQTLARLTVVLLATSGVAAATGTAAAAAAGSAATATALPDRSPRVLGIGGVFFKVEDPVRVNAWYRDHLGVDATEAGYTQFLWRNIDDPERIDRTVWTTFSETSEHFGRSEQKVMINYIVQDLGGLLAELLAEGVVQVGEVEEYEYGRFAWILDAEGNKVELWEPPAPTAPAE